jgi:hypothetical protein
VLYGCVYLAFGYEDPNSLRRPDLEFTPRDDQQYCRFAALDDTAFVTGTTSHTTILNVFV